MHKLDWYSLLIGLLVGGIASFAVFSMLLEHFGSTASVASKGIAAILGAALGVALTLV